jgi:Right handed beta helix region
VSPRGALVPLAALVTVGGAAALLQFQPPPGGIVQLQPGVVEVREEIILSNGAELRGAPAGTVLRLAAGFQGRAAIVVRGDNVRLRDFTIDGNREVLETRGGLPGSDVPFVKFTRASGVLAEGVAGLEIENVRFRNMAGFAVLVNRSTGVDINRVQVEDSGSRNQEDRNNATGGILLEEGVSGFRVTRCELRNIRGNGIWTHSLYTSPRNTRGEISLNRFATIGRDAIQVGHATNIRVEENQGERIGFPVEAVDTEHRAIPVAIDTAGNVEQSLYAGNRFEEINGKCIDLDGFHDGEVRDNTCVNRGPAGDYRFGGYGIVMNNSNPDMRSEKIRVVGNEIDGPLFGGIFVIGTGHTVARNRLLHLNTAHCNEEAARFGCYYAAGEPDMLRSGIYLGRGAERPAPARGNLIEDNEISGFKMDSRCIALAPGIEAGWNTVRGNRCRAE